MASTTARTVRVEDHVRVCGFDLEGIAVGRIRKNEIDTIDIEGGTEQMNEISFVLIGVRQADFTYVQPPLYRSIPDSRT
jgi:hypothetical protein